MAPTLISVLHSLDSSPQSEAPHTHLLSRRHLPGDVTTNIVFGTISGLIALISLVQVAILARRNRVLHCRLLHREENAQSSLSSEAAVAEQSISPESTSVAAPLHQQARPQSLRARSNLSATPRNTAAATPSLHTPLVIRQPKQQSSRESLALLNLLGEALQSLSQGQCGSHPFIFDKSSRQS